MYTHASTEAYALLTTEEVSRRDFHFDSLLPLAKACTRPDGGTFVDVPTLTEEDHSEIEQQREGMPTSTNYHRLRLLATLQVREGFRAERGTIDA